MRHRAYSKNIHRTTAHMAAMRRNLASSLFQHGKVTTTLAKAKDVQRFVERLITLARQGTLHARRLVISRLHDRIMVKGHDPKEDPSVRLDTRQRVVGGPRVVAKLFDDIAPSYADRPGGYTRIVKIGKRRIGDGGQLAVLQLVDPKEPARTKSTAVTARKRKGRARYALADKVARKSRPATEEQPPADAQPAPEAPAEDKPAQEQPAEGPPKSE